MALVPSAAFCLELQAQPFALLALSFPQKYFFVDYCGPEYFFKNAVALLGSSQL